MQTEVNLNVVEIDKENPKEGLRSIFDMDCDFTENEEYFREDTLELGYENEADRLIVELFKAHKKLKGIEKIQTIADAILKNGSFITSHSTYSSGYNRQFSEIGDTIILSIAYGTH